MINFLLNIITHPAFGVVTFLAGLLIGNYFSITRDRRQSFNNAALEFQHAFTNQIRLIADDEHGLNITQILTDSYSGHANALLHFLPHLDKRDRTEINKAWNIHCWNDESAKKNTNQIIFAHYIYLDNEVDKIDCRKLALFNINHLLSFAELR